MPGAQVARTFRLREGGISCDERGLSVGPASLLCKAPGRGFRQLWSMRDIGEINRDLSAIYGLPIDAASKISRIAEIARALTDGELARAGVGALLLQFPEPPALAKHKAFDEAALLDLAAELGRSGLLKANWDPEKHPRTGESPNRGWFAPVEEKNALVPKKDDALVPNQENAPPGEQKRSTLFGWPSRVIRQAIREAVKRVTTKVVATLAEAGATVITEGGALLVEVLENLGPSELNRGEQKILDEWHAADDPAKTLEELQIKPTKNTLGYDLHHIVEQNPANVEKTDFEKFTQERLDEPDNLVWVPRLRHERISAYYSETDDADFMNRTNRDVIKQKPFDQQREIGLARLRAVGVLK
jgi:hypothetical protein